MRARRWTWTRAIKAHERTDDFNAAKPGKLWRTPRDLFWRRSVTIRRNAFPSSSKVFSRNGFLRRPSMCPETKMPAATAKTMAASISIDNGTTRTRAMDAGATGIAKGAGTVTITTEISTIMAPGLVNPKSTIEAGTAAVAEIATTHGPSIHATKIVTMIAGRIITSAKAPAIIKMATTNGPDAVSFEGEARSGKPQRAGTVGCRSIPHA
jgi:hypothetical protein